MKITNALVYDGDSFVSKDIFIENGIFTESDDSAEVIDANGCYAIPGLIDLHFHGCMGYDFCDHTAEALQAITDYEAKSGITTICPATMSLPQDELLQICKTTAAFQNTNGANICGIHLEGPFLSNNFKGAQNAAYLRTADFSSYQQLQDASNNLIKIVSLAPELPKNHEFIKQAKDSVRISLAHSGADYETAKAAFDAGATHVTHLFNAMPPFHHRNPGIVGAALDSNDVRVEMICDGIHIHPSMIRAAFAMFTDERIILISDSMEATGLSDGTYSLGGQTVTVKGRLATLSDHTIAGSVSNLMDCIRYLVKKVQIPLTSAIRCATVNPAKELGIFEHYGSISPHKVANLVLLSPNLDVTSVLLAGKKIV